MQPPPTIRLVAGLPFRVNASVPQASPSEDDRLVARLIARDPQAWDDLLREHGGLISSVCRAALARSGSPPDPADAADASAEVIRSLLADDAELLKTFRPGTSLAAYLRVVAHSRTLNATRRRKPSPLPGDFQRESLQESPEALLLRAERLARLKAFLASLPAHEAEALRLFHGEGLSYAEIAPRVGLSEGTLGNTLTRLRGLLKSHLGEDFLDSA